MLTRWLASFAVTAVVVVTVVVANQTPVSADFLSVKALGNEIVYRVDVQDPDTRIAKDTLQLEIKGGSEKYYIPLLVGESSGSHLVFNNNGHFELLITPICAKPSIHPLISLRPFAIYPFRIAKTLKRSKKLSWLTSMNLKRKFPISLKVHFIAVSNHFLTRLSLSACTPKLMNLKSIKSRAT